MGWSGTRGCFGGRESVERGWVVRGCGVRVRVRVVEVVMVEMGVVR